MRVIRRFGVLSLLVLSLASTTNASPAGASPQWAPAATARVHPGVQTITGGGQCTANFVFYDTTDVYIGQAAHCASTGGPTEVNGCSAPSLPLGTPVSVGGASRPGALVYSSWRLMQERAEADAATCQYNDLALVRLDPADRGRVNPSIPHWGGPNGLNATGTVANQPVYSYGNSSLRLGLTLLSPKIGISQGDAGGGWSHSVSTLTPGIPGDSGSAFLDKSGRALGILSTLNLAIPGGLTNGVGDLRRELEYMRANSPSFQGVELALGTVAFNGFQLPLGL